MKKILFLFFVLHYCAMLPAQDSPDSLKKEHAIANADDPHNFLQE